MRTTIEKLLKPVVEKDAHRMFDRRKWKPVFHQDNAPAHAARKTQQFLRESWIDFIPKEDWAGNQPDLAIMDFFVFGRLKQLLYARRPTTIAGLKRVAIDVWNQLDQKEIKRAFDSWADRVYFVIESDGYHTELNLSRGERFVNKENL